MPMQTMATALCMGGLPLGEDHFFEQDVHRLLAGLRQLGQLRLEFGAHLQIELLVAARSAVLAAVGALHGAALLKTAPAGNGRRLALAHGRELVAELVPGGRFVGHLDAPFFAATLLAAASCFLTATHKAAVSAFAALSISAPVLPPIIAWA